MQLSCSLGPVRMPPFLLLTRRVLVLRCVFVDPEEERIHSAGRVSTLDRGMFGGYLFFGASILLGSVGGSLRHCLTKTTKKNCPPTLHIFREPRCRRAMRILPYPFLIVPPHNTHTHTHTHTRTHCILDARKCKGYLEPKGMLIMYITTGIMILLPVLVSLACVLFLFARETRTPRCERSHVLRESQVTRRFPDEMGWSALPSGDRRGVL